MADEEIVWSETTDGDLIRQLFGHFPTLHEARIRSLDIDRRGESATMVVDYRNLVGDPGSGDELCVRMALTWKGVQSLEMTITENSLTEMSFLRRSELLRTNFELGIGTFGFIESEGFEARLDKVDPLPDDEGSESIALRYG